VDATETIAHQWPKDFWPHQASACNAVVRAITAGKRRIVLTGPCGTGKTRQMMALIEWAPLHLWRTVLYTHRRLLFTQTSGVLDKHGIQHGLRAAGHPLALLRDTQLAMTQSEFQAVFRKQKRRLHNANLVLSDELHAQGGGMLPTIHAAHYDQGAAIVGVTATPLDLEGQWDELIVACSTSGGRLCGALVPAVTYCPDFPDLKHIKNYRVGEDLTDKENSKAIMRPGVFGRVYDHWKRLNPEQKPTILFGPDVAGSLYFAQQFHKQGVNAAHIDAKQIWVNGEYLQSDDDARGLLLERFQAGEIKVLCNRFVLREGIDLPCVAHAILACVFGSLKTYLQAGGRALRSHPSMSEVIIQDHGGNYIRHSSLNADREWELGQSGYRTTGLRLDNLREHPELEPIVCPKCGMARLSGPTCPKCGYTYHFRSRLVVQINGTLRRAEGPSFKPHPTAMHDNTQKQWERYYHGAKKCGRTFNQAAGYMFHECHYYPPKTLKMMPIDPGDWYERIVDVPKERLR